MIEPAVQAELRRFKAIWEPKLASAPVYALDGSWLSVGVLDALTFSVRKKTRLEPFEDELLRGVAAYLGAMAADCWTAFGCETSVEHRETGVVLRATAGPGIASQEEVVAHVERDLRLLLEKLPKPFAVFSSFNRNISEAESFLSPFAFSLFSGLLPIMEGVWEVETIDSFAEPIDKVLRHLAGGCADAYGRAFPDEPLGQVPELYLRGLIYPLTMMLEDLPARHAVQGIIEFAKEYKVSRQKLLALATNLARTADERISRSGFAVAAGVAVGEPTVELLALAASHGIGAGIVRQAMLDATTFVRPDVEWLNKTAFSPEDIVQAKKEQRLGLLPWVKMPIERVLAPEASPVFRQFVAATIEYNMPQSVMFCDQLVEQTPDDFDLRLQRIYLDVVCGFLPDAETGLKNLLTEIGSDTKAQLFNMLGTIVISQKNFELAEKYLRKAQNLASSLPLLYAEASSNLGWLYLAMRRFDDALGAFDESLRVVPESVVGMLNKALTLRAAGRGAEAVPLERRLFELAPFHRAVFRQLVFDPAARELVRR